MFAGEFEFVMYSTFEKIKEKIEEKCKGYEGTKEHIERTFKIINENPFTEITINSLLEGGWVCNPNYYINNCSVDKKNINLEKKISESGKVYDFYERDIVLMHELNHAAYDDFKVGFQSCLSDRFLAFKEFENRLINEYFSRRNRSNPEILRKAVLGFGLEPQIYDSASYEAFKDFGRVEISPLAKKDKSLLKKTFVDGPDEHYYKDVLRQSLSETPNEFWKEFFKWEEFFWQRTRDFLMDEKVFDNSPVGNYALVFEDNGVKKVGPILDVEGEYYFRDKKHVLNYIQYFKKVKNQDLEIVKIQKVHPK